MTAQAEPPRLPPIDVLNQMPREAFVEAIRPLFETAPPLAEGLWHSRPYRSYEQLIDRAAEVVASLSPQAKVEVINAHPRIGESPGAVRQRSQLSYKEQGYEAEASLERAEREHIYQQLADLNREYEQRFGFKFVVFVNRRPKAEIITVLRERLRRSREAELDSALSAMLAIARDRLKGLGI